MRANTPQVNSKLAYRLTLVGNAKLHARGRHSVIDDTINTKRNAVPQMLQTPLFYVVTKNRLRIWKFPGCYLLFLRLMSGARNNHSKHLNFTISSVKIVNEMFVFNQTIIASTVNNQLNQNPLMNINVME